MAPDKDLSFRMRLTERDRAMLEALAKVLQRSASDTVRFVIAEKFGQILLQLRKTRGQLKSVSKRPDDAAGFGIEATEDLLELFEDAMAIRPSGEPKLAARKKTRSKK